MILADALAAALPELRAEALSRMISRVTVRRRTGAPVTLPDGRTVDGWTVVATGVPFRSSGSSSGDGGSTNVTVGGTVYEDATGIGHFPGLMSDLADSDLIEVTAGEWVGDVFRIVAAVRYDQKTARRVPIVEAQAQEGWT